MRILQDGAAFPFGNKSNNHRNNLNIRLGPFKTSDSVCTLPSAQLKLYSMLAGRYAAITPIRESSRGCL
jgi:hypothetical protein